MENQNPWSEIVSLLQSAESKLAKAQIRAFESHGLTAPQVSILLLIDKKGAMKISDIADELDMINSNASNICSRLEKAGLIARKRLKDDQRVVKVELTDVAQHKMAKIKACSAAFHQRIEENVAPKDLEAITAGLVKLNNLFDLFSKNKK